jgi:Tfp pilus assembly protein PilV
MKLLRSNRGDTIVEVLIAITVVSLILAGAYGVATRSARAVLQAQEHSEALQTAQAQLEGLRTYMANPAHPIPSAAAPFCMNGSSFVDDAATFTLASIPDEANNDHLSTYPAACKSGVGNLYNSSVIRTGLGGNTFIVKIRWVSATGHGNDEVKMSYRIYPTTAADVSPSPPAPAPGAIPFVTITASHSSVNDHQPFKLHWTSTNTTTCTASVFPTGLGVAGQWTGPKPTASAPSGYDIVEPDGTATYTLTCTGPGGTNSDSVTVTLNSPGPPGPPTPHVYSI